ncbi:MAG: hypothetical protein KTR26_01960 [Flammeovirgaceae bacterium]|nr:hypothetical protein [Flammeovirgaceae bacterium]
MQWIANAPAESSYSQIVPDGETIIPNGRKITPMGNTFRIAPHPYGLVLSKDGSIAISANSGTEPFSITIIENPTSDNPAIRQIPEREENDEDLLGAVFMGLSISPDNQKVYVAGGQQNKIYVFDIPTGKPEGEINCAVPGFEHGYIGDMVLSTDGSILYAVDQVGFRMMVIDTETKKILHNVQTGRYPFGITLSPDEKEAYIANVGMFEYKVVTSWDKDNPKETALNYPAFAYNSKEAREGIKNDSIEVPALGDPNVPESFSVWTVDLSGDEPQVTAKVKTGILVGEIIEGFPAVGGSSPNSVVATDKFVFVSNGNNDCISVIDVNSDSVITEIFLTPDERLGNLRGVIPFGLALSPDNKQLFVAESGINAVGVIEVDSLKVRGHLPVGWFPSKLAVSPNGEKLIVANAKGYGSGPNGGPDFKLGVEGSYIGKLMKGSVTVLDIPFGEALEEATQKVIENNFMFEHPEGQKFIWRKDNPIPIYSKASESPIKHIVFISKENRTYDEVFGQIKKGRGEPSLARYGMNANFSNKAKDSTVTNANVMVNHIALAKRFSISDNFYVDSDHSADGHRWLVNTYPNEWVETSVTAAYGGKRRLNPESKAPGNLALVGSTGAIYPEDYNEAGSIWDHLERNNIDFFNFGFGLELQGGYVDSTLKYTGVLYNINYPVPTPLYDKSSKKYATYNMAIPDQFRADMFMEEFNERWMGEGKELPPMLTVILPNDHGSGDRPHAGFPFRESYMMDNDLALGRIIEFLSHTPYWENMAIVVTEDDSQDGRDHIDAHRSILMVISPYAKRDYVSHGHYSFGSIFKTFWHILGLPYLNQYDAGANDLADMFTDKPDFTPYNAIPVDKRAFDPQKVLDPFDEKFDWEAVVNSPILDNPEDFIQTKKEEDQEALKKRERMANPRGVE